ncbi:hypothetical protein NIES25_07670 [Nostoc linckia NIES-25]|nr:hypothetical protein NIES25_07670 [Nostoc linckia NIES-25]
MNLNELPGAEIILPGLTDLHNGECNTIGALLVAIAAGRLTQAGLDIPKDCLVSEPELTLYARLQDERDDAYVYYNALLNVLNSFCNALELSYKYKPSNFTVKHF